MQLGCKFVRPIHRVKVPWREKSGEQMFQRTFVYRNKSSQCGNFIVVVVVVVFYCPYAQSISCSEDINVETDECKHFSVVTIDVETL